MMTLEEEFDGRLKDNRLNTSYPLSPEDWSQYKSSTPLLFANSGLLSFYVHIPFCNRICTFCEYTKMICPDNKLQLRYLQILGHDIRQFVAGHKSITLQGFDIGGGTPTSLDNDIFLELLHIYTDVVEQLNISNDFEPSIEGTFETMTVEKMKAIVKSGIKRISLGIQSTNASVLSINHRNGTPLSKMKEQIDCAHAQGIKKINIDLMYGLKGQTMDDLFSDMKAISILNPEQVTLYELRTNMIKENSVFTKDEIFSAYSFLYDSLRKLGYYSVFGRNTFTKNKEDFGVSSYLRSRMFDAVPYKGFGISAQSMNDKGISYNVGKNKRNIVSLLEKESFEFGDTYLLPRKELYNKYMMISGYCNKFSLRIMSELLGRDIRSCVANKIQFLINKGLIMLDDNDLAITKKGFVNYGAVISYLWM